MISELINREFSVRLSEVSIGRLLKKLGLSPQRPKLRSFLQDELLVVEWMVKDFPARVALPSKTSSKDKIILQTSNDALH